MRALFVTWDGPQTTYLESLFFPQFAALRAHGVTVSVLQFTTAGAEVRARRARAAEASGLWFRSVQAPRWGLLGQARVGLAGRWAVRQAMAETRSSVLYPRSLLPLAACLGARERNWYLLFDADGLPADERVDFAGWSPHGWRYRVYRDLESEGVRSADRVVTRTARARTILAARAGGVSADHIAVIPNGKSEVQFSPGEPVTRELFRAAEGVPRGAPWAIYVGSIGPQYHPAEMLAFHEQVRARAPDARLTLLTSAQVPGAAGVPGVSVAAVPSEDVPRWLAAADLGLALRSPTFSQQAVCPIKVGEYLLCGLPVLGTRGVGDLDEQLDPAVAHLLGPLTPAALTDAADWWLTVALPERARLRDAARRCGVSTFGLTGVVERYVALFAALGDRPPGGGR